ncbi:GH36-type glycosyl hydrolase domain-containing protein [Allorhizobium taibaishanense]|uniref:Cyclic beta-1,2-glucan synthetase n=1 Tax=Allorhizobium taibaishanense TaxID=887144 RepID=A0A1Q9A2P5_9HYPH|nr:glucoamylase family protein [Allorhizobium taibaishanense]MBB4009007.1 cyclic beta-1,2-glucan synthetase [Allorhizobium taibaishanense]OLP48789.1 protein ndvB [Allorhizobium taibaishanense]
MSPSMTPSTAPRDTETRSIDHNDSIRATYLTIEELQEKSRALATSVISSLPGFFDFDFFARHKENEREILRVYRTTAADVEAGATITPAAEWLLDNHYIIEEAIQEVRRDFPRKFYRQLPTVQIGDRVIPRVMALAWLYVAHTHSTVTRESMTALAEGYQSEHSLEIGELWALPSMVRFVLVENLKRISTRVEQSRQMRRKANEAADEIVRLNDEAACREYLKQLETLADDNTFATQFLYRLRNGSQTSAVAVSWLEQRLEANGRTTEEAMASEHNRLSSGNVTMGSIIKGLRTIDDTEWSVWVEEVSHVDKVLRTHSDYEALDFGSRNSYRNTIEKLARRSDKSELEIAQIAIDLSKAAAVTGDLSDAPSNVGSVLVGAQKEELERAVGYRVPAHIALTRAFKRLHWLAIALPILALTALALALIAWYLAYAGLSVPLITVLVILFALPASEGATGLFNTLATFVLKPARLAGYEFKEGIPEDARTLVAVPCMISKRDHVDELVRNLEVHYLTNPRGEVYFALLSDWPDAKVEETPSDLEVFEYAKREVAALNARYNEDGKTRFYFLHRRRLLNPQEDCWMGWERKRGKLHELNLLLRGDKDTSYLPGANMVPEGVQYVMTLDADTRLMRDAVTKLVGKMYHPINRPVHDPETGRVISGYGILQPRVTPSLTTGKDASVFQRVFSINRGLDPYVFTVSDVYQDITGEGSFTGKGLYHVDAFERAIKGQIDENTILSHDLLEGSFARCALVTDVELVEDFPTRYEVEISRQHRWARGDWQLLPYILDPKRGITALGRWKMVDNLRRSLTPIAWFAASVIGWFAMNPIDTLIWQLLLIFSLFVAPTISLINALVPRQTDIVPSAHFQSLWADLRGANAQVALRIVFIADMACMMADAIVRSMYRLLVTRKFLLEWRTAASIQSVAQGSIATYYRTMRYAPTLAIVAFGLSTYEAGYGALIGLPFSLMWVLSPLVAWYVSQSAETEDRLLVPEETVIELRRIARRTWRYYETFANAGEHFLPPDNFQETPEPVVARRTSPTNIGVYLLSIVSARHFGWLGFEQTIEKLEQTIGTVEKMDKFRGHIYNWYHTDTLKPLGNRYISAVDSGNLAGHLIAISSACRHWAEAPSAHLQGSLDGIGDVGGILMEALKELPDDRKTVRPLRTRLYERIIGFNNALASVKREHEFASIRVINLAVLARDIQKLAANLHHELRSDKSTDLLRWSESLVAVCESHIADSAFDLSNIEPLRQRLASLRDRSRDLAFSMDFAFLFRKERRLLSIGYRVETMELDEACYDLLASEARLTSLFAIAKGDLPTEHWYKLGRQVVPIGSRAALVSWSGSMFEYLMPPLVMQERQGGILNQTNNLIVKEQMNHGKRLNIPWGISEAAFNARDHALAYQYTNFGVPTLGLKRGLGQNAVIAPYASILASQYDPKAAAENLKKLRSLGALGAYGFHDAVDFTPTRVPKGKPCAVVYNYYAHHHGMSIAAIANVTFNGLLRELFHADPVIEAAELLLQEKAPREIPVMSAKYEPQTPGKGQADLLRPEIRTITDPLSKDRELVLLSNGHYSVMLTATGSGFSRWNGLSVSRWKPDPTEDRNGTFIFLRDTASGEWWSTTAAPRRAAEEKTRVVFSDDKAEFTKTVGDITSTVECVVATEHDAEGRRVTLLNTGTEDRFIEVTSYMEPVLSSDDNDNAHPVFSRMFVKTELGRKGDVIRIERNKRSPSDPDICVAHLVSDTSGPGRNTEFETDRYKFIGRGRTLSEAVAFDPDAVLSGSEGFTLDPIASFRRVLRVPAGKKVSVVYWTIAAPSRQEVDVAIERYRHPDAFNHEMLHAWTRTQVEMRHIGITSQQAAAFQQLGRYLIYPDMHLRADPDTVRAGLASQSALWPNSISGDYPIFAVRINDEMDTEVVREALSAQDYLQRHGVVTDVVVLNERAASYAQDMQHALEQLAEGMRTKQAEGGQQHVFAVRRDLMDESGWNAVLAAARVVLHARNGKITDQVTHAAELFAAPRGVDAVDSDWYPPVPVMAGRADRILPDIDGSDLEFWNGYGGFAESGAEYVVRLGPGQSTPQPWINVISNDNFGFHISAEGAGFTWSRNSRDYQLTPWSNDTVTNRTGEAFYVADLDSGEVVSPIAAASNRQDVVYETRHGLGYSVFSTEAAGLAVELTVTVDQVEPVRFSRLKIRNTGNTTRRLRSYGYVEWILGNNPMKTAAFVLPSHDAETGALLATNPYSIDYSGRFAFLTAVEAATGFASSRREFIGRHGDIKMPQAVAKASPLSGSIDPEGDPCAALAFDLTLEPGEEASVTFLMGDAATVDQARSLIGAARAKGFDGALNEAKAFWGDFTGHIKVKTGDKAFDHMVNHWLPYQTLACRIKARAGFYQASGAYGFRDQLQDSLAFLLYRPELARNQILNAASRQFKEGDVQHWWLPQNGAGIRSTISDDVVWLAYAIHSYVTATADKAILDADVSFLDGPTLALGRHDAFFQPEISAEKASLYEHAARALDLAITRTGTNGLPLILGGDWNDGMNRVGVAGRGESIWLGWFLANALTVFAPFAEERKDSGRVKAWTNHLKSLKVALEKAGWDGDHYRRGYFDDGDPLGSDQSDECRIDAIAQSWSVLSGFAEPDRQQKAMDAVVGRLIDDEVGIVRLFTPPFEKSRLDPGYIKSYPPGVRENGGQYTHAAIWTGLALSKLGRTDEAWKVFSMLNPVHHAQTTDEANRYRVEPYVVAADVYGGPGYEGRGGWTWYTGSAGWLYRFALEGFLGIHREGQGISLKPALPSSMDAYEAEISIGGKAVSVKASRKADGSGYDVSANGVAVAEKDGAFAISL